jgi:hypothetical protein
MLMLGRDVGALREGYLRHCWCATVDSTVLVQRFLTIPGLTLSALTRSDPWISQFGS